MRALTYHGSHDVRVETVPDPTILEDDDIILRVTSTAICGSDLHLYRGSIPQVKGGDIFGHEFLGEVVETGRGVTAVSKGERVIVPLEHIVRGELHPDVIISHRMSLEQAADGYRMFDRKEQNCRKVILRP